MRVDRGVRIDGNILLGDNCTLYEGCQLVAGTRGKLRIGDGSHIGRLTLVSAVNGINIGDRTAISGGVMIYSSTTTSDGRVRAGRVRLGSDVLVGANAVLLPGVVVNDGASVGAGAVVTGEVAAGTVVVGMPARPV